MTQHNLRQNLNLFDDIYLEHACVYPFWVFVDTVKEKTGVIKFDDENLLLLAFAFAHIHFNTGYSETLGRLAITRLKPFKGTVNEFVTQSCFMTYTERPVLRRILLDLVTQAQWGSAIDCSIARCFPRLFGYCNCSNHGLMVHVDPLHPEQKDLTVERVW